MTDDMKSEPPPLDAERQRLRAQGYNDAEISQILIARALGGGASPTGTPVHPQGILSNVLGSIVAVASYAGGLFTSIRTDIATILDRSASAGVRAGAFVVIAIKAVVIGALAFAAWQEWQQHIISAPQTAASTVDLTAAQAVKAKEDARVAADVAAGQAAQAKKAEEDAKVAAEVARGQAAEARKKEAEAEYAEELAKGQKAQACSNRMKMIVETIAPAEWGPAMADYNRDCNPQYASCQSELKELLSTIRDATFADAANVNSKLNSYKDHCPYSESERDQLLEVWKNSKIGALIEKIHPMKPPTETPSPQPTETTTAREPEPTPTPTSTEMTKVEPSPTPSPLRTPANFDCVNGKHMGTDYVICASPELLDAEARLEDAYQAAHRARGDSVQKEQWEWIKRYGPDCGLPLRGRPRDDQITSAARCIRDAIEKRILELWPRAPFKV